MIIPANTGPVRWAKLTNPSSSHYLITQENFRQLSFDGAFADVTPCWEKGGRKTAAMLLGEMEARLTGKESKADKVRLGAEI